MPNRRLSIFVDESGDFGPFQDHCQFYIVGLALHDQSLDIAPNIGHISSVLAARGFGATHAIHTGPLIRNEGDYNRLGLTLNERQALFQEIYSFAHSSRVTPKTLCLVRANNEPPVVDSIQNMVETFIADNDQYFRSWDSLVIYYDNGQEELSRILKQGFYGRFSKVEIRNASKEDYVLLQVADLFCTLRLLKEKLSHTSIGLSKSEKLFFSTPRMNARRSLLKRYLPILENSLDK